MSEISCTTAALELRREREDDEEFLCRLYASTREAELAPLPWSEEEKREFLVLQFNAQRMHYARHYYDSEFCIVVRDDVPIGRLYLRRSEQEIRIVDVALLPRYRGQGIGSRLLVPVLQEAQAAGVPVRIHVENFNPAMRLYKRLGFECRSEDGVYHLMEWSPSAGSRARRLDEQAQPKNEIAESIDA